MKKILLACLVCLITAQLFSMGPTWNMISLLKVPTDTTWEIGLKYYYIPDSIKLISGLDTIKIIPSKQRSYSGYEPDTIITKQTHNLSLLPQQGKIIAIFYSLTDRVMRITKDSVTYGNFPNAICPKLGGSRTFHHQQTTYLERKVWLSEDNKPNILGFTWTGKVYNSDGTVLKNKKIQRAFDYFMITILTDETGSFTIDCIDSQDWFDVEINSNYYNITPLSVYSLATTVTADIHLLQYLDQAEQPTTTPLSVYINNNTATIKYETNEAAHLAIYTADGQCVARKEISASAGMQIWELTELPKGVLVCAMQSLSGEIVSQTFVMK